MVVEYSFNSPFHKSDFLLIKKKKKRIWMSLTNGFKVSKNLSFNWLT